MEKGQWKLQSWTNIGLSAGLSEILAKQFYGHLCAYAHSGCQSAQQVGNAETKETQKALCVATMKLIMIAMANIIKAYCQLFEKSNDILQKDEDAKKLLTSGFILELLSKMSFKHSVNIVSHVVKMVKIDGLRTSTECRQSE